MSAYIEVVKIHVVLSILDPVLEEGTGEVVELFLVEVHPVLPHAGLDDLAEVALLEVPVLVDVIDVEQELDLGVVIRGRELGHRLYELALGDVAAPVLVKDLEYPLDKELILAGHDLLEVLQVDLVLVHPQVLGEHGLEPLRGLDADLGAPGGGHDEAHQVVHLDLGGGLRDQNSDELGGHAASGEYLGGGSDIVIQTVQIIINQ